LPAFPFALTLLEQAEGGGMPAIRQDIKDSCETTGHSLADLSRETDILYPRLSGAVNGYWHLKNQEEERIRRLLLEWKVTNQNPNVKQ
jgi:hypothetical protein